MRGSPVQHRDFSGGLNTKAGPYGLEANEAASILNFRPTMRGSLRSRKGDEQLVPASSLGSNTIVSMKRVLSLTSGAGDDLLLGMSSGDVWRYTSGVGGTFLGSLSPGANVWDWVDAPVSGPQGPVYGTNGAITGMSYITAGGTVGSWTASAGTLPVTSKYLAYVGNRMWAAGMTSFGGLADPGSALAFTELGDPRNWPNANVVQFDPNDGESITGIGEVGSGLLVLKRSKAWFVYDLDTGANRPLGTGVGGVSHRTIQQTPIGTIFLGPDAVWVTDGSSVRRLSDNIEPDLLAAGAAGYLPDATATVEGQRYILTWPTANLYEYDWEQKSWWTHSARGNVLATRVSSERDEVHVGGSAGLDRMFRGTSYVTAAGGSLQRYWYGPYLTLGSGNDRLRGLEVEGSGTFGVAAIPNFGGTLASLTAREVRSEEAVVSGTPRREGDFRTFNGAQPPVTSVAIPSYTPTDVQLDSYTLYVTRRPG
jgi:hypothetical protein